jgi:hypothetical protein
MSSRISEGGVSEQEIREALLRQGLRPTIAQIGLIQRQWQAAIEDYLLEFSARGKNFRYKGDPVLVVHDGSLGTYISSQLHCCLLKRLSDPREASLLCRELEQMLVRFNPREAISRFRPLLPAEWRFELVDQIRRPVAADIYRLFEPWN